MVTRPEPSSDPVDAYLQWGLASSFRFFKGKPWHASEGNFIGLVIEWKTAADALIGVRIAASHRLAVPSVYTRAGKVEPRRVWAASVPPDEVAAFIEEASPFATQIQLAPPVSFTAQAEPLGAANTPPFSNEKVLAAILDDGCAFANSRFLQASGLATRVLWLWNQDESASGWPLHSVYGPSPSGNFGYGKQWSKVDLDNLLVQENGRQEPIYALADLPGLRRAVAHGPHVMDLLCGSEIWPVVFVQFPRVAIDDPSGIWLHRYGIDGLNYILECAGPSTEVIVVNLSWGPQTGPHDGSSPIEVAIDELVAEQKALGRTLIVSVPAGNSFGSRAHAQIDYQAGGSVRWHVPPDGRSASFLEVWWPSGVSPQDARLQITPPGSAVVAVNALQPWDADNWYATIKVVGNSTMALVCVNPTEDIDPGLSGRHGAWILNFGAGQTVVSGDIHVYVARADHNMGARRRAKASYLSDTALEVGRLAQPPDQLKDIAGSSVRRYGTLNGLATGAKTSVAAGYRFSSFTVAPYSSAGGSRGNRIGPDYACVTDRSAARAGLYATGVRSGTSVRLVGTSMAAPQLGRQLTNNSLVPFLPLPLPVDAATRIGTACLWPDAEVIHKE